MTKSRSKAWRSARRASKVEHIDAAIASRLGAHHQHPVVRTLGATSEIADQPPLIALCLATAAAGVVLDRPAVTRTGIGMLASMLVATGIIARHHPSLVEPLEPGKPTTRIGLDQPYLQPVPRRQPRCVHPY